MKIWLAVMLTSLSVLDARAHPIVSTDINRHVTLTVTPKALTIRYVYNMLEIAAVNVGRSADSDGDGSTSEGERDAYAQRWSSELRDALKVQAGDTALPLNVRKVAWELGPAPFGLNTWTLTAELRAPLPEISVVKLSYEDTLRPNETGWKEVILRSVQGARVSQSSVGSRDRSNLLTDYVAMADLPNPDEVRAQAEVQLRAPVVPIKNETSPSTGSETPSDTASAVPDIAPAPVLTQEDVQPADPRTWRHYAWPFFRLGMHHIATGWDHLAFLLGLLLFRQRLKQVVWVVTAFTLAHSLTLALASLGWVKPPDLIVEVLIALSIAYVGAMALWKPDLPHGPIIAFGFGLMHGFGFAGFLAVSLSEASGKDWLVALAGFNLGIETLQVAMVLVVFPLLLWSQRFAFAGALRTVLALGVTGMGAWWTIERMVFS